MEDFDSFEYEQQNRILTLIGSLYKIHGDTANGKLYHQQLVDRKLAELANTTSQEDQLTITIELAGIHTVIGEFNKQKEYLDQASLIDPNDSRILENLGDYYYYTDQYDSALSIFKKVEILNPTDAWAQINVTNSLVMAGQAQQGLEKAEGLIIIYPKLSNLYGNMGLAYLKLKKYTLAKEYFDKTLELKPNNSWVYRWLGTLYLEQDNKQKACECFQKAKDINYEVINLKQDLTPLIEQHCKE